MNAIKDIKVDRCQTSSFNVTKAIQKSSLNYLNTLKLFPLIYLASVIKG